MSVSVTSTGHFKDTLNFLDTFKRKSFSSIYEKYGELGVRALQDATPIDSGKTATSWSYKIKEGKTSTTIEWHNTNVNDGVVVAVLIQYGHATRNGGYVPGYDFINPAMKPILRSIADQLWKEVSS